MAALRPLILLILLSIIFLDLSRAGTRMLEPPSRASLWRYGYNTPRNIWDDMTDCGGYQKHHIKNGGKCGVCGDPSDEPTPRRHEAGGEFSPNPTPVRAFETGSYVTVVMETSSSLFGKLEFRLCNISDNMETPAQSCFDQNLLAVLEAELGTEYQIGSRQGIHVLNVQLPASLVCRHCILQWTHTTGFTTNQDSCLACPGGESKCRACKGCGNQVWHVGCTDITIYNKFQSPPASTTPPTAVATTQPLPASATTSSSLSTTSSQRGCTCPNPDPTDNLINGPTSYTGHFSGSTQLPDTATGSNNSNNGVTNFVNNTTIFNNNSRHNTTKHDVIYSTGNYNFMNESKTNVSIEKTGGNDGGLTTQAGSYNNAVTASSEWRGGYTTSGFDASTVGTRGATTRKPTSRLKHNGGLLMGAQRSHTISQYRVATTAPLTDRYNSYTSPHTTISQSRLESTRPHTTVLPHNPTHINSRRHTTKSPDIKTHTSTSQTSKFTSSFNNALTTTGDKLKSLASTTGNALFCYVTNKIRNPRMNFDLWCHRNCPGKGIFTCLYHTCRLALCSRDLVTGDSPGLGNPISGFPQGIYRKQDAINKHGASFSNRGGDGLSRYIIDMSDRYVNSEEGSHINDGVYRHHQQFSQQQQQQQQQQFPNQPPKIGENFGSFYSSQNSRSPYVSKRRNNNNTNLMSLLPLLLREGFEI